MSDERKPVRPIDLLKAKIKDAVGMEGQFVSPEVAEERLSICKSCPNFRTETKLKGRDKGMAGTCRLCGCFMAEKVTLPGAFCPMNPPKWDIAPAAN